MLTEEPKIRGVYNPPDQDKETIKKVYDRLRAMEESREPYFKKWDGYEKQYEAYREPKDTDDWQSNIFVPITTAVIESILAEIVGKHYRPLIIEETEEYKINALVMNHAFNYTWEEARGDFELIKVIKDMLIFGTAIAEEMYYEDKRTIQEITEYNTETGEAKYEEKEIKDFDGCYMEAVKLQDFFIDERARGFRGPKGARDCIRRDIMHIEDFKDFFKGKIWDPKDTSKYVKAGGKTDYYEFYKPPQGINHSDEVEVIRYYNRPKDKFIVICNDVLIKDGPIPYAHKQLPFARAIDIIRSHQFYGKGESELLESIQEEFNLLRRMRIDRNHLDLDKMFIVSDKEELSEEDLIARPHGMIEAEDPKNAVIPIEYKNIDRSAYLEEDRLNQDVIRTTGIDDRLQSGRTPATATEIAIMKESTLKRIEMKMTLLLQDFMIDIARLRVKNIQQFYSTPKLEKILGDKKSQAYLQECMKLKSQGKLVEEGGQAYKKVLPKIQIEGKVLEKGKDSQGNITITEKPHKGYSTFEIPPELLEGNFKFKFSAGPTLPISKPLMQQQASQMYDRLVTNQAADPKKLMEYLTEVNDEDPDRFSVDTPDQPQGPPIGEQGIVLAQKENEQMMAGTKIMPTPYASGEHTNVHLTFLEQHRDLPDNIKELFAFHIKGEEMAQQMRGQAMGTSPGPQGGQQMPPPMATPGMQKNATAPGVSTGGPQAPGAMMPPGVVPNMQNNAGPPNESIFRNMKNFLTGKRWSQVVNQK